MPGLRHRREIEAWRRPRRRGRHLLRGGQACRRRQLGEQQGRDLLQLLVREWLLCLLHLLCLLRLLRSGQQVGAQRLHSVLHR